MENQTQVLPNVKDTTVLKKDKIEVTVCMGKELKCSITV